MTRVISCRFMRISCSEDDHPLFRRYYARSNRERGVKLLRCFPHCCPEHVQRCYCGSSIHVLVTFATELSAAARDNLVVCARFEPSRVVPLWPTNLADAPGFQISEDGERKLRPGEVASLPINLLASGNQKAKQAVWVRADREGEAKQTTKNAVLYVLNKHRFPKWLYSYDSSVTRMQREMTHHLVVYVFQLTGSRSHRGEVEAAVLARHESPGFSLISYRRSGNNARNAGCDLPAIEAASDSKFAAVDVDTTHVISSTSDDMEVDSSDRSSWKNTDRYKTKLSRSSGTYCQIPSQRQTYQQEEMREPTSPGLPLTSYQWSGLDAKYDGGLPAAEETPSSWQQGLNARNCSFREKGQHLLILWRFLRSVAVDDLGFGADTADIHIRPHWLRAAAILRPASSPCSTQLEGVMASFLSGIFSPAESIPQTRKSVTRDGAVIRMTAHLFLRALSFHKVQRLLRSAITSQGISATGKTQLQGNFVSLVSNVYDQFADILREVAAEMGDTVFGSLNPSLPQLVDEVLSFVYAQPRFAAVRPQISALLLDQHAADSLTDALESCYQAFIALAREGMIAPSTQHSKSIRPQSSRIKIKSYDDMLWNQRWLLEPGSLQMAGVTSREAPDAFSDLHLLDVAQFIGEFGCIDITIEEKARYLSLRSALSLFDGTAATPMTLVLDGKLRVFRVLPSGLSSIIATTRGWVMGDYAALLSDDAHSVTIHFFGFAEGKTRAGIRGQTNREIQVRRINLSIKLEEEYKADEEMKPAEPRDLFAFAHGTVYGSTYLLPQMPVDGRMGSSTLSHLSSLDRAAIWRDATWTPLWEFQAGYIGMP